MMKKTKKTLKAIGIILLLVAMAYASNWDVPKSSWTAEHAEELQKYEEAKAYSTVTINGETYEGAYLEDLWCEPAEVHQEVTDEFLGGNE